MRINHLAKFSIFCISVMLVVSCAPPPLFMKNGEVLDKTVKSNKIKVAVLPTVDWSEEPTCIQAYGMSGGFGIFSSGYAYENGGLEITNEITKSLWKQNVCFLEKEINVLNSCGKYNLTKSELFPQNETGTLNCLSPNSSAIDNYEDVGNGNAPNYEKLYNIGNDLGVDIVYISRLSVNAKAKVCGAGLLGIIQGLIVNSNNQSVQVDLIALDVKKRSVISFGQFGAMNWATSDDQQQYLDDYGKAMVYYFNLPADETLRKKALASAASYTSTLLVNVLIAYGTSAASTATGIPGLGGIQIGAAFNFEYDISDVTWQQYGPNYFSENYEWSESDYLRAIGE